MLSGYTILPREFRVEIPRVHSGAVVELAGGGGFMKQFGSTACCPGP